MKKTLIALALAALPVASMADVVLYGQIKGGVEVSKYKGAKGTTTGIVDYGSRIGFKGEEQLNGSLKAIWQLEQKVDIAGGATGVAGKDDKGEAEKGVNGFGTRDSFIGLKGDSLGTVKAGYISTPVKDLNDKLDEWEYASNAAGLGIFTRGNDAVKRAVAVQYETPNFGGFSARAYVSPSDNNTGSVNDSSKTKSEDSAIYGLGFSYAQDSGVFADLAGTYVRNGKNNEFSKKRGGNVLAQVGYQDAKWLGGVAYQYSHNVDAAGGTDDSAFLTDTTTQIARAHEVAGTVAYNVDDALRLKGSVAAGFNIKKLKSEDDHSLVKAGKGRYYQGIIGADYALSKRTVANAQIGYVQEELKTDSKKRYGTVGVGVSHKF